MMNVPLILVNMMEAVSTFVTFTMMLVAIFVNAVLDTQEQIVILVWNILEHTYDVSQRLSSDNEIFFDDILVLCCHFH